MVILPSSISCQVPLALQCLSSETKTFFTSLLVSKLNSNKPSFNTKSTVDPLKDCSGQGTDSFKLGDLENIKAFVKFSQ